MPTPIDSGTEVRRAQLARMLGDGARAKDNGLDEGDAKKHLLSRGKTPSISEAQASLLEDLFESGSHRNDLNENNAWKLVASHKGAINEEQLRVATAIIKSGRKANGVGEHQLLRDVLKGGPLNARQADVLLHILRNGGDRDWNTVGLFGNKFLDSEAHFNTWAFQQVLKHPELTELQAVCLKKLVELTKGQVKLSDHKKHATQLFDQPPRTQSEADARIASYLAGR